MGNRVTHLIGKNENCSIVTLKMVTTVVKDETSLAVKTYQMQATIMETFIVDLQKIGGKYKNP